ncbi:ABC transporter permease [Microbacterium fluvii]|uniref:ABC transporter permease n=1 Tax=Microbacterium fluvii TaxID=415215 RepID=A0ABW2H838_9MICO|nr:ABC transporter permease subunit [Microbacterium fluvii]MCU4671159.1 ABC transporter permease subunit [Microbacterium fluvii]
MSVPLLRRINVPALAVALAILLVWQLSVESGLIDFEYLPSPTEVWQGFLEILARGQLVPAISHTLGVTAASAAVAIVIGVVLGAAVGLFRGFRTYTMASFNVLRTLPIVALMPVALMIWGPTGEAEFYIATFSSIWPVLLSTASGVRNVHPRLTEVARSLRFSRPDFYGKILLPASLPSILVGARLAVVHALVVVVVAEVIVNPAGLGGALLHAQSALQPGQVWAWVIISGIIGYLLNVALVAMVRYGVPGGNLSTGALRKAGRS